jgi:uncharacterized MAPEG superfamily protein
MNVELKYLAWSTVLGLVYVLVQSAFADARRGLGWTVHNRDDAMQPLAGAAGRAQRASRNFLETFPLFAAAVLAVMVAGHGTAHTAQGAMLYFWARLLYLPVYLIGIPYLRTLIWTVAVIGLGLVLTGLF